MNSINFILPSAGLSGGVLVVLQYARLLKKRGYKVNVYVPIIEYDLHRNNNLLHNKMRCIYRTQKNMIEYFINRNNQITYVPFINEIFLSRADIVIATAWPTAYEVAKLSSKCKKAYFIQDYEIWDNKKLGKESYKLPLEHIVIAKWIDNILVNELGCKPGYLVHNGIDTEAFHPSISIRKKRFNTDHKIQCLMLYHTLPKKGIEDGIKAFKLARKENPNLSLIMFGMPDDPKIDCVDQYYKDPEKGKLVELYQTSDIFIYPSREEGWGLTTVEAMACGCAVAGTNTGCMTEVGKNGKNALLSEPYDSYSLGKNIIKLCDRQLRSNISIEARKTAETLSWERSADLFEKILNNISDK